MPSGEWTQCLQSVSEAIAWPGLASRQDRSWTVPSACCRLRLGLSGARDMASLKRISDLSRKACSAALVWVTTAATVVAGMPRSDCLCPNGRVKPFCRGPAPGQVCCCADAAGPPGDFACACSAHARPRGSDATQRPCCCRTGQVGHSCESGEGGPQKLRPVGCKQLFVAAAVCTAPVPAPTPERDELFSHWILPAAGSLSFSAASPARPFRDPPQTPPPTDLVKLLSRLLI